MRHALLLAAMLFAPSWSSAQRELSLSVGATRSSDLISDPVLRAGVTTLRPAIAPTVALAATFFTSTPYRVIVAVDYATSKLDVTDSLTRDQLARVATIGLVAMVDAPIHGGLRVEAGGGSLWYRPSRREGIFQDGGTRRWLLAAGLTWHHALAAGIGVQIGARYDFHDFTTATLQARDVQGTQAIHRIRLMAGVSRRF
jgi:hypothetical protein